MLLLYEFTIQRSTQGTVLLLEVSTPQGPELHLDVSTLQMPVLLLEVSTPRGLSLRRKRRGYVKKKGRRGGDT